MIKVRGATSTFGRSTTVDWPSDKAEEMMERKLTVAERMDFGRTMDPETEKMRDVYKNIGEERKNKME